MNMNIVIAPDGTARCVYGEAIDLGRLGSTQLRRAGFVEPDARGRWCADLSPVGGPLLGPFARRSDALAAEATWLDERWLITPAQAGTRTNQRKPESEVSCD
jgi:hypothetical protein